MVGEINCFFFFKNVEKKWIPLVKSQFKGKMVIFSLTL